MPRPTPPTTPPQLAGPSAPPPELAPGGEVDHLSLISLPTAASSAGVLVLIAAWFALIFAVGLWGLHTLPASLDATFGSPSESSPGGGGLSLGRLLIALGLSASLTLLSVVIAMLVTWVRPLRSLVRATALLIQGQWHRPIPQSVAAIAPVQQLAVIYEDLRRSLVDRLRSSTELNLQLESEVARRTAELERRNAELALLLTRLEATRAELLRNQKLAMVGRLASDVALAIADPMQRLRQLSQAIGQSFSELQDRPAQPAATPGAASDTGGDARPPALAARLAFLDERLAQLIESAAQASEVVRALRVYARPDPGPYPGSALPDLSALAPSQGPPPRGAP